MSEKLITWLLPHNPPRKSNWRHVASGHTYRILTLAWNEADLVAVVVYQRYDDCEGVMDKYLDGIWVRPLSEFLDGRFERIS